MEFFTIGVFNSTENAFFEKLINNNIDIFCDIRQRRAVRGSKYSFVNSKRLQNRLSELSIKYVYIPGLAPTSEIRDIQKQADIRNGELKTQRKELGTSFVIEYKKRILEHFDFLGLRKELEEMAAKRLVLFCVEEHVKACHRSIVAQKLMELYDIDVINDL